MPALAIDDVDQKTQHKFHLPLVTFKKPVNDKDYKVLERLLDQLIPAYPVVTY